MLLNAPPETGYDLRFMLLGFPVRVAWTFWLGALVLGHGLCQFFAQTGNFGIAPLLLLWAGCLLVSITIHELGHTLAFRYYGINSSIVLYHFGGLAIPNSSMVPGRMSMHLGPKENFIVSLAGPVFQLVSAIAVILAVKLAGYQVWVFQLMPAGLADVPWVGEGNPIDSEGLNALVSFYVYPSVVWALLNLVPVWPLDGGQIARSLFVMNGGTVAQSLWLSVICSGLLALYAFKSGNPLMAMFFLSFGFSSYQMLNPMNNSWR